MKTEENEGYGALGVLSKREAELEQVYDSLIKVGTLEGIGILANRLKIERNNALDESITKVNELMFAADPVFGVALYAVINELKALKKANEFSFP